MTRPRLFTVTRPDLADIDAPDFDKFTHALRPNRARRRYTKPITEQYPQHAASGRFFVAQNQEAAPCPPSYSQP